MERKNIRESIKQRRVQEQLQAVRISCEYRKRIESEQAILTIIIRNKNSRKS